MGYDDMVGGIPMILRRIEAETRVGKCHIFTQWNTTFPMSSTILFFIVIPCK